MCCLIVGRGASQALALSMLREPCNCEIFWLLHSDHLGLTNPRQRDLWATQGSDHDLPAQMTGLAGPGATQVHTSLFPHAWALSTQMLKYFKKEVLLACPPRYLESLITWFSLP
jgi:hypothetical protein